MTKKGKRKDKPTSCAKTQKPFLSAKSEKQPEQTINHEPKDNWKPLIPKGLANLGNTCFLNSLLQCVMNASCVALYFPALCERKAISARKLSTSKHSAEHLNVLKEPIILNKENMPLFKAFSRLITEFQCSKRLNPRPLFNELANKVPMFRGYHQQDAHELLRLLIDALQNEEKDSVRSFLQKNSEFSNLPEPEKRIVCQELTNGPAKPIIDAIFEGRLVQTIRCQDCGNMSTTYETFLDISLPLVQLNRASTSTATHDVLNENGSNSSCSNKRKNHPPKASTKQNQTKANQDNKKNPNKPEVESIEKSTSGVEKKIDTSVFDRPELTTDENKSYNVQENPSEHQKLVLSKHQKKKEAKQTKKKGKAKKTPKKKDKQSSVNISEAEEVHVKEIVDWRTDDEFCLEHIGSNYDTLGTDALSIQQECFKQDMEESDEIEADAGESAEKPVYDCDSPSTATNDKTLGVQNRVEFDDTDSGITSSPSQQENDLAVDDDALDDEMAELATTRSASSNTSSKDYSMAGTNYNSPFIANGTTCRDEDTPLVSNESADDGTGKLSLISALKSFTDFEVIEYRCERCCGKTTDKSVIKDEKLAAAIKRTLIFAPPPILTFHLKRFGQVFAMESNRKRTRRSEKLSKFSGFVGFQPTLNIAPFCSKYVERTSPEQNRIIYSLCGIVRHSGGMGGGHYIAYVRNRIHAERIKLFFDQALDRDSSQQVPTTEIVQKNDEQIVSELTEQIENIMISEAGESNGDSNTGEHHKSGNDPQKNSPSALEEKESTCVWYKCDDEHVSIVSHREVFSTEAYILFYERIF